MDGKCVKGSGVSSLWLHPFPGWEERLARAVEKHARGGAVHFRADDAGVPGRSFSRMMEVFRRRKAPLNLAVVPAWITRGRWEALKKEAGGDPGLWCWHQHGFRHVNHEQGGKKQELGDSRPKDVVRRDILRGRERLEAVMGGEFFPAFTPPWNRCGKTALECLKELGFAAVSRTRGAKPPAPPGLAEVPVDVDLHTIRDPDPQKAWEALFQSLAAALQRESCGIMIHHQRMNDGAFDFLERLLGLLAGSPGTRTLTFRDLFRP